MANVEHSSLTGSDLHEPKGVSSAVADRVYVSNGAGSGSWTQIGLNVLGDEAKAFQNSFIHIQDQKTSGTAGQSISSGSYVTRNLNTVLFNGISGASLSSNQIALPAGVYHVEASAQAHSLQRNKLRIRNVTDGTDLLVGMSTYAGTFGADGYSDRAMAVVFGRFEIVAPKTVELQHRSSTSNSQGGGSASSFGDVEVYADIRIWKVG